MKPSRDRKEAGVLSDMVMVFGQMDEPVSQRFLPLDAQWKQGMAEVRWPTTNLPEVMCGGTATLRALIREYLFISLFRACAESLASENASRLAAMERADKKNARLVVTQIILEAMKELGMSYPTVDKARLKEFQAILKEL